MGIERKVCSFRLEKELIDQLLYFAGLENRTLSNFIETILKSYLNERQKDIPSIDRRDIL
ncbi:hypothetical protein [Acetivibrio sp. MSJd-27]|jgi:predicted DNA-binding protein|uniref:hypothetical protein n=1 Tax=Acetivibrio sp. MSJd-27 TaxID=2841523 RepID=UPI001C10306F|nr:hypothetical protein [Acetivibrio sp. MSJd-27]MBU5450468.1 hypothetical protein [Acetivibrio sp. MSJd-27]